MKPPLSASAGAIVQQLTRRWTGRLGWLLLPSLVNLARSRRRVSSPALRAMIRQRVKALITAGLWSDRRTLRTFDLYTNERHGGKRDLLVEVQAWIETEERLKALAVVGDRFRSRGRGIAAWEAARKTALATRPVKRLSLPARVRFMESLDRRQTGKSAAAAALALQYDATTNTIRRSASQIRALRAGIALTTSKAAIAYFLHTVKRLAEADPRLSRFADPAIAGQAFALLEVRLSATRDRAEANDCTDAWLLLRLPPLAI